MGVGVDLPEPWGSSPALVGTGRERARGPTQTLGEEGTWGKDKTGTLQDSSRSGPPFPWKRPSH